MIYWLLFDIVFAIAGYYFTIWCLYLFSVEVAPPWNFVIGTIIYLLVVFPMFYSKYYKTNNLPP